MSTTGQPAKFYVSFIGNGKLTHAIVKGAKVTMCGKSSAGAVDASDKRPDARVSCRACEKKAVSFRPLPTVAELASIPGFASIIDHVNKPKDNADMAAKKTAPVKPAAKKTTPAKPAAKAAPAPAPAKKTTPAKPAAKKAAPVKKATPAKATAKKAAPAKPTAEVVVKGTTDFMKVEGVMPLIKQATEKVKRVAIEKFSKARDVAEYNFSIRKLILDSDGDPDLGARSDQAKKAAAAVYSGVLEGLPEAGTDADADVVRASIGDIKKDARNVMQDVVVEYLRGLDNLPTEEEAAKDKDAAEARTATLAERARFANVPEPTEGKAFSDAVYAYYESKGKPLPEMTRAEQAAAYRERNALRAAKAKELAAKVEAGELTQEAADAELSGDAEPENGNAAKTLTPAELRAETIKKLKTTAAKLVADARSSMTDAADKAALEAAVLLALSDLREELAEAK